MRKKLLLTMLLIAVGFSLAACGGTITFNSGQDDSGNNKQQVQNDSHNAPDPNPSPDVDVAESASGVQPTSVTASSTSSPAPEANGNTISYDPEDTVDGKDSTAWNVDGDGVGQSITLYYDQPVTVDRIGIIPGYDKVDPADGTYRFYQFYVIEEARIEFSDGTSVVANFARDPSMQYTDVSQTTTDSMKITILDSYSPGNSPEGDNYPYTLDKAAISEIDVEGS